MSLGMTIHVSDGQKKKLALIELILRKDEASMIVIDEVYTVL